MKHHYYITVLFICIFASSCSNKNEAVEKYCNCLNSIASDSIISSDLIAEKDKICLDSIIQSYELNDDNEFIENFDSIPKVIEARRKLDMRVIKNIGKILETHSFKNSHTTFGESWTYEFDGKMFTIRLFELYDLYSFSYNDTKWTGTYNIEKENNGKFYLTLELEDGNTDIYEFNEVNKEDYKKLVKRKIIENDEYPVYFLDGNRTLYSQKKKIE